MHLIVAVVLAVLATVHAGWLEELSLPRGLELGSGISLHLDRLKRENASLLEGHALRVDYSGVGLSVGKALNKDALQLGLYTGDEVEGRKKKMAEILLPALFGFKATGIAALIFTGVTLLVFKALAVAKLGFLVSAGLLLAKYLQKDHGMNPYLEIEEHAARHPMGYAEYPAPSGYSPTGSANYLTYANYGPTGGQAAETAAQYAIVEAPTGNSSVVAVPAGKRHDFLRRKSQSIPILTVRKYTIRD